MRRILITDELHSDVELFCDELFSKITHVSFEHPPQKLKTNLASFSAGPHATNKRKYLREILRLLPELKKAKPSEFQKFIDHFEAIIPYSSFEPDFAKQIVGAMRYDRLRETEYPNFIKKYKLKSCVYCNALLTIVIDIDSSDPINIKRQNMFELDHFLPTSKYPYFCTSFYNLHPTCSNCNRAKNAESTLFQLYTEDKTQIEAFEFNLTEESIVNYWNYTNIKDVILEFKTINNDSLLLSNHNKYFKVNSIYNEQMDLVEELLQKSMAYNKASRENLVSSFKTLFPDETMIKRLIIGNYFRPEEIHQRPMAKLTYDIAKQLGLI